MGVLEEIFCDSWLSSPSSFCVSAGDLVFPVWLAEKTDSLAACVVSQLLLLHVAPQDRFGRVVLWLALAVHALYDQVF